ncbi:MAG: glutamine synthetase family protein, partial [Myxococcaceae bacterium]
MAIRSRGAVQSRKVVPINKNKAKKSEQKDSGNLDELKRWFEEKGVRKVKVGGFDIDGILRGKYISLEKFFSAAKGGMGFCDVVFGWDLGDELYDNARVTGWHTGYPDMNARVDLSTGRILPWEPDTAAFLLDFVNRDGSPFEPSPRQLLQKISRRAREMGYAPKFGAEFEYFLFKETPQSAKEKGYQNLTPLTPGMFGYSWIRTSQNGALVHALIDGLNAYGITVEGHHTETGPGVYETAILFDDLEKSADKAALFKTTVKEICSRHGVLACFMAKPSKNLPGCSGHVHQSLWTTDGESRNAFHDPNDEFLMSKTLRHYIGGQIELMPELSAL